MDILNLEGAVFPLKLKSYIDGSELGIVFDLEPVSLSTDVDEWVNAALTMKRAAAVGAGNDGALDADDFAEIIKEANIRKAIASIKSWDFGGNSIGEFGADGETPECTNENKTAILRNPKCAWIVSQIIGAASVVANFLPKESVSA